MEDLISLRQTVTHLFDAVRYSEKAKELEEAARREETKLETELKRLESRMEEVTNLLSSLKDDGEPIVKDLSRQGIEFLSTAKAQASSRLDRQARDKVDDSRASASNERDKAIKSLESYLEGNPIPIIESIVSIKLVDGMYHATSTYECEGGLKYAFGLAAQNSKHFSHELTLAQLGYELKVPVRFSRTLLKKERVPGFERLDQYALTEAETSGGRVRASFQKNEDGAKMKVVASGGDEHGFVGIEYSDQAHAVNVMNDPSLSAHVELDAIKKGMFELGKELSDLAGKKVALLTLSFDGEQSLKTVDCYKVLELVLGVLGPGYRTILKGMHDRPSKTADGEVSLGFVRQRLKLLGELAKPVSSSLGVQLPTSGS
jgi:ElaB/YqjD/DUF883 family membrane-anchored ribosome-binding protein